MKATALMLVAVAGVLFAADRSPDWPRVRRQHLAAEPACVYCGTTNDLEVHHVVPFHVRPDLELAESNLITLCATPGTNCHFRHGHRGSWTNWNPRVRLGLTPVFIDNLPSNCTDIAFYTNCTDPVFYTNCTDIVFYTNLATRVIPASAFFTGSLAIPISTGDVLESESRTNIIRQLVGGGHVCAVVGHHWHEGCGNDRCLVFHTKPIRYCVICGKTQTQEPGEWR